MIGFPGISKFTFEKGKFQIEKFLSLLQKNPEDSHAKSKLKTWLVKVETRPISTFKTRFNLARAHLSLGDRQKALQHLMMALKLQPDSKQARELSQRTKGQTAL